MKDKIVKLLSDKIEQLNEESISALLEQPPKKEMGDYAFPCFKLAKVYRKAPPLIAGEMFPIFVDGLPQHLVIAD